MCLCTHALFNILAHVHIFIHIKIVFGITTTLIDTRNNTVPMPEYNGFFRSSQVTFVQSIPK